MNSEATACLTRALPNARGVDLAALASQPTTRTGNESLAHGAAIESAPEEQSDEDLLLQVGSGSREALSNLFQRHARSVFNVAQRILKDAAEAEDLLQELFLFIFQKAQLFDAKKGAAASWIIQMAYHRAIDRRRYLHCRQHYNAQELNEERLHSTDGQLLINEIAGRELLNRLQSELSAGQRQTLELHFFQGYSFQEIAEKTGQTIGNVRNHYYRGLERLRSHVFPEKHA